jgi:hypothetical protein
MRSEKTGLLCFLSLVAIALVPNFIWIVRDHTPWPWDQAWYGEVSVDLWFNLTHSFWNWGVTMLHGISMKPPGIVWLGQSFVPFGPVFGSVESALLVSVLLTQAVTLYLVFRIGRAITPNSYLVPALGVSVVCTAQSFAGLSHQFFVEPLQALAVAWTVLIVVHSEDWPAARILLHLVGSVTVGLLAKATTPVYCLVPCLYLVFVLVRKPWLQGWRDEWRNWPARALTGCIAVALPLTALWYAVNLKAAWQHVREASSGEIALNYGSRASLGRKLLVWMGLLDQSFLFPYLRWVIVLAVVIGLVVRFTSAGKSVLPRGVRAALLVSVLQSALLLVVFSMNDAVDSRYMYAMIAFVAVVVMSVSARVSSRAAFAAMFALCALQFTVVHRVAFGADLLSNPFAWLTKPHEDRTQYREMERVVELTSTVAGRYNIVGVQEPWFNENTASFFAAKHRLDTGVRGYFTSLGYAEKDPAAAWKRVEEFNLRYYITLDERHQPTPPDFVNLVSLPSLQRIRTSSQFAPVPFASADGVLIFQHQ